jgi:hypothetical protein
MNVGDQRQQGGYLLAALQQAEFTGGLDFVHVVGGLPAMPTILALRPEPEG